MGAREMTCFSCMHYRSGGSDFESAFCEEGKIGFPFTGEKCQSFIYEPSTDEDLNTGRQARYLSDYD